MNKKKLESVIRAKRNNAYLRLISCEENVNNRVIECLAVTLHIHLHTVLCWNIALTNRSKCTYENKVEYDAFSRWGLSSDWIYIESFSFSRFSPWVCSSYKNLIFVWLASYCTLCNGYLHWYSIDIRESGIQEKIWKKIYQSLFRVIFFYDFSLGYCWSISLYLPNLHFDTNK